MATHSDLRAALLECKGAQGTTHHRQTLHCARRCLSSSEAAVDATMLVKQAPRESAVSRLFFGPLVPQHVMQRGNRVCPAAQINNEAIVAQNLNQMPSAFRLHLIAQGSLCGVPYARKPDWR